MVVCRLMELKMRTQEKKEVDPSREQCVEEGEKSSRMRGLGDRNARQQGGWVCRKCWMIQRLRTAKTVKEVKGKKYVLILKV